MLTVLIRKTKNKLTTIQNQSHDIRKHRLLIVIIPLPSDTVGNREPITSGILNTKSQSAPNSLTQDFSTLSMGWLKGQMEGGEDDLNENYFIICNSSITEVGIFKAVCDIWRPLLCTEVPPSHRFSELCYDAFPALPPHTSEAAELWSAEQLSQGGKCTGPAQQEGWCSKGPAGRDSPSCSAELSPSQTPSPGAFPAEGVNPAHSCTPQLTGSSGVHKKPEELQ